MDENHVAAVVFDRVRVRVRVTEMASPNRPSIAGADRGGSFGRDAASDQAPRLHGKRVASRHGEGRLDTAIAAG